MSQVDRARVDGCGSVCALPLVCRKAKPSLETAVVLPRPIERLKPQDLRTSLLQESRPGTLLSRLRNVWPFPLANAHHGSLDESDPRRSSCARNPLAQPGMLGVSIDRDLDISQRGIAVRSLMEARPVNYLAPATRDAPCRGDLSTDLTAGGLAPLPPAVHPTRGDMPR